MGDDENRNKPNLIMKDENIKSISCTAHTTIILKNNGKLFVFGWNQYGKNLNNSFLIIKLNLQTKPI